MNIWPFLFLFLWKNSALLMSHAVKQSQSLCTVKQWWCRCVPAGFACWGRCERTDESQNLSLWICSDWRYLDIYSTWSDLYLTGCCWVLMVFACGFEQIRPESSNKMPSCEVLYPLQFFTWFSSWFSISILCNWVTWSTLEWKMFLMWTVMVLNIEGLSEQNLLIVNISK